MKKGDLKDGCIVMRADGEKYICFIHMQPVLTREPGMFISLKNGKYMEVEAFDDDLTYKKPVDDLKDYDIVAVCDNDYIGDNLVYHIENAKDFKPLLTSKEWTWVRKERHMG